MKLEEYCLGDRTYELNYKSVKLAKEVMGNDGFVAASIGPLGKLLSLRVILLSKWPMRLLRSR
jgi:5-methyltetrahydrofolate--homocysteine methyltransferase